MKKNSIKTKVIATALSAITILSAGAMTTTTAFAAETHLSAGTSVTNELKVSLDRDLKYATNISSASVLKVLDGVTKNGKYFVPALSGLLDAFIEKADERTEKKVDELSNKVDRIFDKIDASEASIKAELTNDLGVQSFYNTFIKFKAHTEAMNKKINDTYASNLSNTDKIAKIGSLTGSFAEWRTKFEDVLTELNNFCKKPSMTKDGNIFELTYNHYTNSVMFSGEAIKKSKPACDLVMKVYAAGCATLTESLAAQICYNNFSDQTKQTANSDYTAHICKKSNEIESEIRFVSKFLISGEKDNDPNTFKAMYDKVMNKSKSILVNKGHDNIELKDYLDVFYHQSMFADGIFHEGRGEQVANDINEILLGRKSILDSSKAKIVADYARSRGVSVRKALDDAGFDTRNLPEGTTLVTAKAWDDSVSRASLLGGYNYQKAYYKGVNIDDKNAAEYNVQLVDCGWNFWKNSEWNYMVRGYAAMFWLKK